MELSLVNPGSHMPLTYVEHRYGICEHLRQNHLSQELTAGKLVAQRMSACVEVGKPVVVSDFGDENIFCKHHLRTQNTLVTRFDPYLQVELH